MNLGRAIIGSLLIILLIGALRISYWGYMNLHGYCWAEHRYLTNEEKIHAVVTRENSRKWVKLDILSPKGVESKTYHRVPYKDAEDLLNKNPGCCTLSAGNIPIPESLELFVGDVGNGIVTMNYKVQFINEQGQIESAPIRLEDENSNCGGRTPYNEQS